mmetsp:Transcript_43704/g.98806  ORF Transcript_43704/g.98806 Transcript_43704/m.98806 type:complete len:262 (-) Transcript_43704:174-959(-)
MNLIVAAACYKKNNHESIIYKIHGCSACDHARSPETNFHFFPRVYLPPFLPFEVPKGWEPPNENRKLTFPAWVDFAKRHENASAESPHYYFRFSSTGPKAAEWLRGDLSVLTPQGDEDKFFLVDSTRTRGIFCRFGMRGVVSAGHFDRTRNFITVMGGLRRYIISAPKNCEFMYLLPRSHPSERHSQVDWSAVDLEKYLDFPQAKVSELILEPGDFLYIPSGWLHYVMSLNMNWQCNAGSGAGRGRVGDLDRCGFGDLGQR